jgi:hypothetical protein
MDSGINKYIFRGFPVKSFFIVMCVIALMVPVSADPLFSNTQQEQPSLTLLENSSASVPDTPVISETILSGAKNSGKKVMGVIVV